MQYSLAENPNCQNLSRSLAMCDICTLFCYIFDIFADNCRYLFICPKLSANSRFQLSGVSARLVYTVIISFRHLLKKRSDEKINIFLDRLVDHPVRKRLREIRSFIKNFIKKRESAEKLNKKHHLLIDGCKIRMGWGNVRISRWFYYDPFPYTPYLYFSVPG